MLILYTTAVGDPNQRPLTPGGSSGCRFYGASDTNSKAPAKPLNHAIPFFHAQRAIFSSFSLIKVNDLNVNGIDFSFWSVNDGFSLRLSLLSSRV